VPERLTEHPDGKIFTSLPGPGQVSAASMLAESGDCRDACEGPGSIAALAGMCPVTKASGKHRVAGFRWACGKRFRRAMTTFAGNSRPASPRAARVCADAIGRGCDHPARSARAGPRPDPGHLPPLAQRRPLRPRRARRRQAHSPGSQTSSRRHEVDTGGVYEEHLARSIKK